MKDDFQLENSTYGYLDEEDEEEWNEDETNWTADDDTDETTDVKDESTAYLEFLNEEVSRNRDKDILAEDTGQRRGADVVGRRRCRNDDIG